MQGTENKFNIYIYIYIYIYFDRWKINFKNKTRYRNK